MTSKHGVTSFGIEIDYENSSDEELGRWLANMAIMVDEIAPEIRDFAAGEFAVESEAVPVELRKTYKRYRRYGGRLELMIRDAVVAVINQIIEGFSSEEVDDYLSEYRVEEEAFGKALPGLRLYQEVRANRLKSLSPEQSERIVCVPAKDLPALVGTMKAFPYEGDILSKIGEVRPELFSELPKLEVPPKLLLVLVDLRARDPKRFNDETVNRLMHTIIRGTSDLPSLKKLVEDGLQVRVWCMVSGSELWRTSLTYEDRKLGNFIG